MGSYICRLYTNGADMNHGDYDKRTPLHLAAVEGQLDCVRFLLEECKVMECPLDRFDI